MKRSSLIEKRRKAACRLLVVPSPDTGQRWVYVLRRFNSVSLVAAGIADILGPDAIAAAQEQHAHDVDRERLYAMAPEGSEERAKLQADMVAAAEKSNADFYRTLNADPARQAAFLKRCDAYVMGAVQAMGIARDDATDGLQPPGTTLASICIPLTDEPDRFVEEVRFVAGPTDQPGELNIYESSMAERIAVGWSALLALEVASQLRPFRGGPGDARAR